MDVFDVHERAIKLICEVLQTDERPNFNPLSFTLEVLRSIPEKEFWRTRSRVAAMGMSSQLSTPDPEAVAVVERLFGPLPVGNSFGEQAVRSLNAPKFIADELYAEAPLTSQDLDLLERIHAHYVADTGRLEFFSKGLTTLLGVLALAAKLVPKEVFDVLQLHWYGWYQLVVSGVAIWVVLNLGFTRLINFGSLARRRDASQLFAVVLLRMRVQVAAVEAGA